MKQPDFLRPVATDVHALLHVVNFLTQFFFAPIDDTHEDIMLLMPLINILSVLQGHAMDFNLTVNVPLFEVEIVAVYIAVIAHLQQAGVINETNGFITGRA